MVPGLTRKQRLSAGRLSSVSLPDPHHRMTTEEAVPNGVLCNYLWHSLSHMQGCHPLHILPLYVGYCSTGWLTSDGHLSMRPILPTLCLQGGVQQLWLFGHRVFCALLLLGQQRSSWHRWHHIDICEAPWHTHWRFLFSATVLMWGTGDWQAVEACIPSSENMVNSQWFANVLCCRHGWLWLNGRPNSCVTCCPIFQSSSGVCNAHVWQIHLTEGGRALCGSSWCSDNSTSPSGCCYRIPSLGQTSVA